MKCQSLFSGEKNKKNIITLLSAELAQIVVKTRTFVHVQIRK